MSKKITIKNYSSLLSLLVKAIDILLYGVAAILAFYWQFGSFSLGFLYKISITMALIVLVPIFSAFGIYLSLRGKSIFSYVRSICIALITVMVVLAAISFITKTGAYFSRAWFLSWHALALSLFIVFRISLKSLLGIMRKRDLNQKRIVIIGTCKHAQEIIQHIQGSLWSGYHVVAVYSSLGNVRDKYIEKVPVHIINSDFAEEIKRDQVDEVWLAGEAGITHEELNKVMLASRNNVITIRFFPSIFGAELINHSVSEILGMPVINMVASPIVGSSIIIKAIEDKLLSALILFLLSPLFLIISLLVKLSSPGPVFYKQKRISWNGKAFEMLKFRSMPVNAESKTGAVWAKQDDQRATKIGAFLRKTSLDELPQFINVLNGDMSIVGPRPERPEFVDKFKHEIPGYMKKHLVKAGITGWAQVNGWRGNTDLVKRIECDLYYITHWSLGFDLKIIFLTIFKGFVNKNAY
ncbi:MAG: undecaprenyl-phosphate glucose phosphotransferase [Gammaproteobacteria bacterium]